MKLTELRTVLDLKSSNLTVPGVYFLVNHQGEIVYIGQSRNVHCRIFSHRKLIRFSHAYFISCKLSDLDGLERSWISRCRPIYNKINNPSRNGSHPVSTTALDDPTKVSMSRYFDPEAFTCATLREWANVNQNNRNRWSRTRIGATIREVTTRFNNFKNAPRGNPKKAGLAAKAKKEQENLV